jgi:hypothetical protein
MNVTDAVQVQFKLKISQLIDVVSILGAKLLFTGTVSPD